MNEYQNDVKLFSEVLADNWSEYQRKLRQWAFLNAVDFDEDVLQETFVKCYDLISRKGLKDKTKQGCLNYFFLAYRNNTYQQHLQNSKRLIDDNADIFKIEIEDEDVTLLEEQRRQYAELARQYILQEVQKNFDNISYSIFRLRHCFTLNGKTPTFKQLKEITKVPDTRKRLIEVTQWIKAHITKEDINNYIKNYNSKCLK